MFRLPVLALLAASCSSAFAMNLPDNAAMDRIGQTAYEQRRAPGFSLAVWYKGQVVFAKGYGYADVAKKIPVTADTRFSIGSITKQFTAASVLMLAERGKLSLDNTLDRYLPEMPNASRITLRMLLNQTSGLHNYPRTDEHTWPLAGQIEPAKLMAILKTDKPDFAPGEKWEYSNTNYAALAEVVAKTSGMPFDDFVQKNIVVPLGMAASGAGYQAQQGIAIPYEGTVGNFAPAVPQLSLDLFYGAGNIVSSASDLMRWDAALIEGRLLKQASMHDLWTAGKLANGQPVNYAMGFVPAFIGGHREMWHNGYAPKAGGYCLNAIFPDDQLAVVVLSNSPDAAFRGAPEQIARAVLATVDPQVNAMQTAASPAQDDEDARAQAVARKMFEGITREKVDRSLLSLEMNAALTPEIVSQASQQFAAFGTLLQLKLQQKTPMGTGVNYNYGALFAAGDHKIQIFVTNDGKVGGFHILP